MGVSVALRTVTGAVHTLEDLASPADVEQLYAQASTALSIPPDGFKLVLRGSTVAHADADASSSSSRKPQRVALRQGDVLLVMPQRKAPSERLQRAAAEAAGVELPDEDDAALRFSLPPGTPAWQRWLARVLQERCQAPELLLVWLFTVGPGRLLALAGFLAGCKLASRWDLGPIWVLLSIVAVIFTSLGRKREGEASAYSVFNPGVARLPGQLDADVLDEQIRRGQM